ncbi:DUF5686 and carboxypeptidase regulatory-like domain-containing protein [Flavobacterium alkalisoli]|uniref:DUF5686 and carboxypeptidase regulatory-like domain-containing protein n=1 Tax=Flavobacterium alkalisoli TaxID=2602769 RepID=UPI003A8F2032
MYKLITCLLLLFTTLNTSAQIKGKITTTNGEPVPFVSVSIENTYTGTTANEEGVYELGIKKTGTYVIVFQSIGFKTKKETINITSLPHTLNIVLQDETYTLSEVVISNTENPANRIIREAIAHKKENSEKTGRFEADFYSKGLFRVKNVPTKIMGVKVEDEEMTSVLDSTGSGIVYLSETVSKITFEQPNNLKERIVASKISGNDNGFSYNTALGTYYNFYDNYIEFNIKMVSPLANNAFNYYKYKFEGTFFDDNNNSISKIKVIPRRDKEPVFEGYIYIVDDSWAIYAVDFDIKGYRMQQPILENLNLKQNFSYNTTNRIWAKNSQTFDIKAGIFGVGISGTFTHVYNNYVFRDHFEKGTFGKEIVYIEEDSNKKDSIYWQAMRPIPLTDEEVTDYFKKDSIQTVHKSPAYLDSIDKKSNKFHLTDIISGYSYRNSAKNTRYSYEGLLQIPMYNTVQGWVFKSGLSFRHYDEDTKKYTSVGADFNYGVAEDRLRVTGWFSHRFGKVGIFTLSGGSKTEQFNASQPISPFVNSVSTLFFKDNYMKLYDKTFARLNYSKEIFTGLNMGGSVQYLRRKQLFNNTDYVLIKNDHDYTSNNPLAPNDYTTPTFDTHHLMEATVNATVRFGQKYITRPDGKINVSTANYPTIAVQYTKAFAASESQYEYDFIAARTFYNVTLGNKGDFGINLKAGKFFNADNIAFMDYKHFNGNQTHVNSGNGNLNAFNLLPYYSHSTNDSYFESHAEHNFKGFIMNKVPLLNKLQWNLVVGYHGIATPDYKPYHEFTAGFDNIGFGKFRVFRVDYVRAYQGGFATDGIMFGLKFLDIVDNL